MSKRKTIRQTLYVIVPINVRADSERNLREIRRRLRDEDAPHVSVGGFNPDGWYSFQSGRACMILDSKPKRGDK